MLPILLHVNMKGADQPAHLHSLISTFVILSLKCIIAYYMQNFNLSYDVASESEITPCIKFDKSLVVYRFSGNIMK